MNTCVFCKIATHEVSAAIVYEDDMVISFLDIRPQTRGHLQLVPRHHSRWIYDIADIGSFFEKARTIIHAIIPVLGAEFVTLATFGQEVEHAHLWIVPQYKNAIKVQEGIGKKQESQTHLAAKLASAIQTSFATQQKMLKKI